MLNKYILQLTFSVRSNSTHENCKKVLFTIIKKFILVGQKMYEEKNRKKLYRSGQNKIFLKNMENFNRNIFEILRNLFAASNWNKLHFRTSSFQWPSSDIWFVHWYYIYYLPNVRPKCFSLRNAFDAFCQIVFWRWGDMNRGDVKWMWGAIKEWGVDELGWIDMGWMIPNRLSVSVKYIHDKVSNAKQTIKIEPVGSAKVYIIEVFW